MHTLPSPSEFVKDATQGIREDAQQRREGRESAEVLQQKAKEVVESSGVSQEFLGLIVNYCSQNTGARELSEVNWRPLATRLGTEEQFLQEAARACDHGGKLWAMVIQDRIKRASASKIFRDSGWERLESLALNRLTQLAEKNLIKDTGELLAIASHARRATEAKHNGGGAAGGTTINIGLGGESMDGNNGLPAAGTTMKLDLTPRLAQSLQNRQQRPEGRVIDGQMLSANELREALDSTTRTATVSPEGDIFEGDDK